MTVCWTSFILSVFGSLLWNSGCLFGSGARLTPMESPAALTAVTCNSFPAEQSVGLPTQVFMTLLLLFSRLERGEGPLKRKELNKNMKSCRFLTLEKGGFQEGSRGNGSPFSSFCLRAIPITLVMTPATLPIDTLTCPTQSVSFPLSSNTALLFSPYSPAGSFYWSSC